MEKLNVKVGDAVIVNCPDETSNIVDYVVKVMPNGRFRLHGDQYSVGNSFWRANGTKNTKACETARTIFLGGTYEKIN